MHRDGCTPLACPCQDANQRDGRAAPMTELEALAQGVALKAKVWWRCAAGVGWEERLDILSNLY